ncbi:hypothetical protein Psuf_009690 [Phytohabitans suffuscus]|uniref:Uncharacterized protein n=1 Tax=Phytohabitans suffuscus TaxID=624315 RepID=A0A6F8YC33_9ACTN|nr:hypothetical protein Psuf_009690 [Phytohabitans suffuscus]
MVAWTRPARCRRWWSTPAALAEVGAPDNDPGRTGSELGVAAPTILRHGSARSTTAGRRGAAQAASGAARASWVHSGLRSIEPPG